MKHLILFALFVTAFAILTSTANAQAPTRINFARGATSVVVSGTLKTPRSKKVYLLRVGNSQTLRTEQLGDGSHPISIWIRDPNGDDAGDMDASCHNRYTISPTIRGDYRLTVEGCKKADNWRGSYRFRISVR